MQSLLLYLQDTDVLTAFISLVCVKLFNVNQKSKPMNKTLNSNGRNYGNTDLFLGDITVLLFIILILFLKL